MNTTITAAVNALGIHCGYDLVDDAGNKIGDTFQCLAYAKVAQAEMSNW